MTNFTKETYLATRAAWKANYAKLTEESRKLRQEFKEAASLFSKTPYREHTAYWANYKLMEALRDERRALRLEAYTQINVLAQMKEDAAAAWAASRAA